MTTHLKLQKKINRLKKTLEKLLTHLPKAKQQIFSSQLSVIDQLSIFNSSEITRQVNSILIIAQKHLPSETAPLDAEDKLVIDKLRPIFFKTCIRILELLTTKKPIKKEKDLSSDIQIQSAQPVSQNHTTHFKALPYVISLKSEWFKLKKEPIYKQPRQFIHKIIACNHEHINTVAKQNIWLSLCDEVCFELNDRADRIKKILTQLDSLKPEVITTWENIQHSLLIAINAIKNAVNRHFPDTPHSEIIKFTTLKK